MIRDERFRAKRIEADLFDQPAPLATRRTPARRAPRSPSEIPFLQRPTCTIDEACRAAGLGRTKLYELIRCGVLETSTVGRRRLVLVPSLLRAINFKVLPE